MQTLKDIPKETSTVLDSASPNDTLERIQLQLPPKIDVEEYAKQLSLQALLNIIKLNIENALEEFFFKPNDRLTRMNIYDAVDRYLESVSKDFLEDYYLICDETNNPPSIVDQGIFVLDIGLKTNWETKWHNSKISMDCTGVGYDTNPI